MRYIIKGEAQRARDEKSKLYIDPHDHKSKVLQKETIEFFSKKHYDPSPRPLNNAGCISRENLIEFLSRPARRRIVECLCEALVEEREKRDMGLGHKRKGRPCCSGVTVLASRLGVSRKSVSRWLVGEMQSSNSNAEKILELAQEYVPDLLRLILGEEVEKHILEVSRFFRGRGDGP